MAKSTSKVAAGAEKKTARTSKASYEKKMTKPTKQSGKVSKVPRAKTTPVRKVNKTAKRTEPSGKVSKVARAKKTPDVAEKSVNLTIADMVRDGFENNKGSKGSTLASIRIYISKKYDVEMTKYRQTIMKKFIKDEFDQGRMKMTNHVGDEINYTKRFKVISTK